MWPTNGAQSVSLNGLFLEQRFMFERGPFFSFIDAFNAPSNCFCSPTPMGIIVSSRHHPFLQATGDDTNNRYSYIRIGKRNMGLFASTHTHTKQDPQNLGDQSCHKSNYNPVLLRANLSSHLAGCNGAIDGDWSQLYNSHASISVAPDVSLFFSPMNETHRRMDKWWTPSMVYFHLKCVMAKNSFKYELPRSAWEGWHLVKNSDGPKRSLTETEIESRWP